MVELRRFLVGKVTSHKSMIDNAILGKFARFATLACLCVFPIQIWAAENAYVSVTASSGSVVCDGLDFYIEPNTIGDVGSVDIHVSAKPGWKLESPDTGACVASGGGSCGWSVVSDDDVNPEDSASGVIWVGEVVVSGMPDMMLRQDEKFATLSYRPLQIKDYTGVSVSSDNDDVSVSIVEGGQKIKLQRIRAREDVACGSDNARVTVSLGGNQSGAGSKSRLTTLSVGRNSRNLVAPSVYEIACRKDIEFLSATMLADANELLTSETNSIYAKCLDQVADILTSKTCNFGDNLLVNPVTPSVAKRAAQCFADKVATACGRYAGDVASGFLLGQGFKGVVLESWKWKWNIDCSLNFVGGDLVFNPPYPTISWLNSFQEKGFTSGFEVRP